MNSLISDSYRALNTQLHEERPDFGANGHRWAGLVQQVIDGFNIKTVLDYGCGKASLAKTLPGAVFCYDPAIAEHATPPQPAELVVCTDVLEHVEPEKLFAVLDDLRRLSRRAVFLVIATRPAKKTLADGRNAHLIQKPIEVWLPDLMDRWTLSSINNIGGKEFIFVGQS